MASVVMRSRPFIAIVQGEWGRNRVGKGVWGLEAESEPRGKGVSPGRNPRSTVRSTRRRNARTQEKVDDEYVGQETCGAIY